MYFNYFWSLRHTFNVIQSKNLTYFYKTPLFPHTSTRGIYSQGTDFMYPDAFGTELSDSLTAFYEKILKKVGTKGCAVGKALPRKFEAQKIPVPVPIPST